MDGALLAGDCAGFMNSFRLKGIHLAMKSGMLAAETAFEARPRRRHVVEPAARVREAGRRQLDPRRSSIRFETCTRRSGTASSRGLAFSAWTVAHRRAAGRGRSRAIPVTRRCGLSTSTTAACLRSLAPSNAVRPDRVLTFDKVTSVHYSGTRHDEDQPPHLLVQTDVCYSRCGEEFGHPCQRFCPAHVYEMIEEGGRKRLQINAANCVHCKTCDIMDPYQVITWVPPEGGGGPQYDGL